MKNKGPFGAPTYCRLLAWRHSVASLQEHRAERIPGVLTMPIKVSMIAASAPRHIATRNVADFKPSKLRIANPFDGCQRAPRRRLTPESRNFGVAFEPSCFRDYSMHRNFFILLTIGSLSFSTPFVSAQEPKPAEVAAEPAEVVEKASALDLIPAELVNAKGEKVSKDSLKGKIVGLYFSAHWCPPCRKFTPELVAFRDANVANFEVVFISSDKDEAAMKGYMEETKMLWPAVSFADPAVKTIKKHFEIRGIPTLVIIGADGHVITKNGRGDVTQLKDGAIAAWKAK